MPTTAPDLATLAAEGTPRQAILRALAEAVAELRENHPTLVALWRIVDDRGIESAQYAGHLNEDPRIDWAHPTTWNRRKNKALGRPNWRDDHPDIQRRRRTVDDEPESA